MYQIEETQSTREKMSYSDVDVVTPLQPKQVQLQQYPAHSSWSSNSSLENNPVSPCFSIRQSTRFSSTTNSSVASSPTIRSSLDGFNKMPLAGVKEEKEKESIDPLSLHDQDVSTLVEDITNREYLDGATAFPDYDWIDTPACEVTDYEFVVSKRRCPDASSTSLLSSRFTGRFPNIAKKLRSKRENRSSSVTGSIQETIASRSRASSLRSPSIFDKTEVIQPPVNNQEPIDLEFDSVMNVEEEEDELFVEVDRTASRTPLLPPVLTLKREEQIQSPLQSPSVDATPSLPQSPFDSPNTFKHLPSPPLSTKPSVASFHHRTMLPPSAEIPIINLSDAQDEWSIRLGHGNFTISPEPYQLQAPVTLVSCQRLKADWELARNNFALHIKRTGQVYSETSKTYYLTQAKWSQINLRWKSCYEQALGDIPSISQEMLQASFHSQDSNTPSSLDAIPSSPIISSKEGKFPKPAASGIVGPMEQIKPMISPRSCRKRSFWKFLQGVWPSGAFGVSQA